LEAAREGTADLARIAGDRVGALRAALDGRRPVELARERVAVAGGNRRRVRAVVRPLRRTR